MRKGRGGRGAEDGEARGLEDGGGQGGGAGKDPPGLPRGAGGRGRTGGTEGDRLPATVSFSVYALSPAGREPPATRCRLSPASSLPSLPAAPPPPPALRPPPTTTTATPSWETLRKRRRAAGRRRGRLPPAASRRARHADSAARLPESPHTHTHTHTRHRRRHHASASFSPPGREPPAPAAAFENKAAVRKPPGGCVLGRPGSYAKSAEAGPAPSARRAHGSALTAALRKARRRRGGKNAHLTQGGGGGGGLRQWRRAVAGVPLYPAGGSGTKGGDGDNTAGQGLCTPRRGAGGVGVVFKPGGLSPGGSSMESPRGCTCSPSPPPPCSRFLLPTALSWAFLGFSLRAKLQFSL